MKQSDPQRYQRASIRLKDYDYTRPGAYYITIVSHDRECRFGEIIAGAMQLNRTGRIIANFWQKIPRHFRYTGLDVWVVMPNHIHGIIVIHDHVNDINGGRGEAFIVTPEISYKNASPLQASLRSPQQPLPRPIGTKPGSLAAMVQNFKSITTRRINKLAHTPGAPLWQRNYWEHIIRDESELNRIRAYIINNPYRWEQDREHFTSGNKMS